MAGANGTPAQQQDGEPARDAEEQKKDYSLSMSYSRANGNNARNSSDDLSDLSEQEDLDGKGKESFTTRSSRG